MNKKILIILFFTLVITANVWTQQERRLKYYTTYQTSLTNAEIVRLFVNEVIYYLQRYDNYGSYYLVQYEVYQAKNEQNYAWGTYTYEKVYQWGTIYIIYLYISNACLEVAFCNRSFSNFGQQAMRIVTTRSGTVGGDEIREHIVGTAFSMFNESDMTLKMYNDKYSDASVGAFADILRIMY